MTTTASPTTTATTATTTTPADSTAPQLPTPDSPAPIGWFEIAGSDPTRIEAFYGTVFGWSFADDASVPGYRIVSAGEGIPGGVNASQPGLPSAYAIFSVMVPDVAATCAQVAELGGEVLVGPVTVEANGLVFANLRDPDGNQFGVFSPGTA